MLRSTPRRWITRLLVSAAFLAISTWSHALPITYNISVSGETGSVSGSIETDGTIGTISTGNIMSWAFTVDDGVGGMFNISTPTGSLLTNSGAATAFSATLTDLSYDFTTPTHYILVFRLDTSALFREVAFDGSQIGSQGSGGAPSFTGISWTIDGPAFDKVALSNTQVVGTTSTVPEPTTMLLFASGLLGLAGYRWHQRRREGTQLG